MIFFLGGGGACKLKCTNDYRKALVIIQGREGSSEAFGCATIPARHHLLPEKYLSPPTTFEYKAHIC